MCESMKKKTREIYTGIEIQFWLWKGFENIILMIDCKFKTLFDAHLKKKSNVKDSWNYYLYDGLKIIIANIFWFF